MFTDLTSDGADNCVIMVCFTSNPDDGGPLLKHSIVFMKLILIDEIMERVHKFHEYSLM